MKQNFLRAACAALTLAVVFGISTLAWSQDAATLGGTSSPAAVDSTARAIAARYYFVTYDHAHAWAEHAADSLNNPPDAFGIFLERALAAHERDSLVSRIDSLGKLVVSLRAQLDSAARTSNSVKSPATSSDVVDELQSGNAGSSSHGSATSTQCLGRTKKGARCKRMTKSDSGYCWQHEP